MSKFPKQVDLKYSGVTYFQSNRPVKQLVCNRHLQKRKTSVILSPNVA